MALLGVALVSALLAGTQAPDEASAKYTAYFTAPFAKTATDPCSQQGVGSAGGIVVRNNGFPNATSPKRVQPLQVALLCGPVVTVPFGTLLQDDAIWHRYMGRGGSPPGHLLTGGSKALPWNTGVSTHSFPWIKGPNGHGVSMPHNILSGTEGALLSAELKTLFNIGSGGLDTLELAFCVMGAVETAGVSCAPLVASVTLTVIEQAVATFAPDVINLVARWFQRNYAINNSEWFAWSNGWGLFNGFGDIDTTALNPSITILADKAYLRIGVALSNAAVDQGYDFFDSRNSPASASAAPASRLMRRLQGGQTARHTHVGSNGPDRIVGTRRADAIDARAGADLVRARAGNDLLVQGGSGNDRLYGGDGNDNLDGDHGRDLLVGGRGDDQIVDRFGPTRVRTGPGRNVVMVRDGRGDDVVQCNGSRFNLVIADRRDRVSRSCRVGRSYVGARPPGVAEMRRRFRR